MTAPSNSHERYEQLAVGHALSALEPEDEQAFLEHLPACASCMRALADHTETLAHLAYGAEPVEPPASLLEGIRAGVAASGRAGEFPVPAVAPMAPVSSLAEHRARRTVRLATALTGVAASIVLVAALLLVNHDLASKNDRIQARDAALQTAVASIVQPGAQRMDMTGEGDARAVALVRGGTVSLVVQGLEVNDTSDSTYVLWQRSRFGDVKAVGTFDVTDADVAVVNGLRLSGDVKSLIVTKEAGRRAPAIAKGGRVVSSEA